VVVEASLGLSNGFNGKNMGWSWFKKQNAKNKNMYLSFLQLNKKGAKVLKQNY
jgi:hypothetical protein